MKIKGQLYKAMCEECNVLWSRMLGVEKGGGDKTENG